MTAGEQVAAVVTDGRPRTTQQVEYEPAPTVCPVCSTDLNTTQSCPQNCPTREVPSR
ncbi:hypothetical protein AB0J14_05015 [Micromonospora arborensis]|uniref:hypothetical protein n=1 Tax=Micromonospora arborensis TaxID=2116518 RepID=UPI0033C37983